MDPNVPCTLDMLHRDQMGVEWVLGSQREHVSEGTAVSVVCQCSPVTPPRVTTEGDRIVTSKLPSVPYSDFVFASRQRAKTVAMQGITTLILNCKRELT